MNTLQKAILTLIGAAALSSPAQAQWQAPLPPGSYFPTKIMTSTPSTSGTTPSTDWPKNQFPDLEYYEINDLEQRGVPEFMARGYDPRFYRTKFDPEDFGLESPGTVLERLSKVGLHPDVANSYPAQYSSTQVARLYSEGITPMHLWKFPGSLAPKTVLEADEKTREQDQFDARFSLNGLSFDQVLFVLKNPKVTPASTKEYAQRFSGADVLKLISGQISANSASQYNPRFSAEDIADLSINGIDYLTADSYPSTIPRGGIVALYEQKISGEKAAEYLRLNSDWGLHLDITDIGNCIRHNITVLDIESELKKQEIKKIMSK